MSMFYTIDMGIQTPLNPLLSDGVGCHFDISPMRLVYDYVDFVLTKLNVINALAFNTPIYASGGRNFYY